MQQPDPLVSYRLGAVRVGIQATLVALLLLVLVRLLPGHGSIPIAPYAVILFLAAAGVVVVWRLPWGRLFRSGLGLRAMYAWSVLDIILITFTVGVTGGGRSDMYLLYGLTTVFFGAAYPPRSQGALLAFTFACYVGVLAATGWEIGAGTWVLRCGSLAIVALLVSYLSRELLRVIGSVREAGQRAERSAALLSTVAGSARRLTLERDLALEGLVDGVLQLGFSAAAVCSFDHEADQFMVSHHRGMPPAYVGIPHPVDGDLPGLVRGRGKTVVVDEDRPAEGPLQLIAEGLHSLIASPVWVDGWLAGTLVGASHELRAIPSLEVDAFQLLAAQAGLAIENAQRFEETLLTVQRLEELDKLKDNFLATASHEIRTPLTVILGSGLTLEQRWDELDDSVRHELVAALNRNAKALEELISSLLDFARLGADSMESRKERCALREVVQGVTGRLASMFAERPLEVAVEDRLVVMADPFQLERVIENLLSNASRHTPQGTRVRVSGYVEHGWAVVEVADDGPGMSEEDARHLGERFYRGADINNRGTKGLGLGVALVQEILELHGTDLEVETRLGAGSRFIFRLPLADEEEFAGGFRAAAREAEREPA